MFAPGRRVTDYICDGSTVWMDTQPIGQWIRGKDVDEAVDDELLLLGNRDPR